MGQNGEQTYFRRTYFLQIIAKIEKMEKNNYKNKYKNQI